jgi:uncharacterized membrane protein HdeD (DUF308 family)
MQRLKAFLSDAWPLLLPAALVATALLYVSPTTAAITVVTLLGITALFSAARYNRRGKEIS